MEGQKNEKVLVQLHLEGNWLFSMDLIDFSLLFRCLDSNVLRELPEGKKERQCGKQAQKLRRRN
jgi:hypothetical protein